MQVLRAVFASDVSFDHLVIDVLQKKKQVSVDDMIVITHNLVSVLTTSWRQASK